MNEFLTALGLVAVIEGLVLVLAPSRFENLIRAIESMNHDTRRVIGLKVRFFKKFDIICL